MICRMYRIPTVVNDQEIYESHLCGEYRIMGIAAGVDFGTLSVRVTLLDRERGRLGTAFAAYPLHRHRDDPDFATQSHEDQMAALVIETRAVLKETATEGLR